MIRKVIISTVSILLSINTFAREDSLPVDSLYEVRLSNLIEIENRVIPISDLATLKRDNYDDLLFCLPEHPAIDSLLSNDTKRQILLKVNARNREIDKDTLLTSDLFYIWKPYFKWLEFIDPHCRIDEIIGIDKDLSIKRQKKLLTRLPFDLINVNDTLIVNNSINTLFAKGDVIESINGVSAKEYLKYNYRDRYTSPVILMRYYYYSHAVKNFSVKLIRDGKELTVESRGENMNRATFKLGQMNGYGITSYPESNCGYIRVAKFFPNNNNLIKTISSAINKFKQDGLVNVIIDLRINTGGNGHNFDKLISIFTDKSVPYSKAQKLRVSQETLEDYDFLTEDMLGENVVIPERYITTEVPIDSNLYIGGVNYYILMSKDTGSIAASFCNILQYANAATLVGEPLKHNALKYGETVGSKEILPTLLLITGISSTGIDEYSKAVDGVLYPDISIPYVASEYMTGRDAVLDNLLEIIKNR